MIRVSTKYDFNTTRWNIVGKPILNSKYSSWRRNRYSVDNNYFHKHALQTHGSPILGPTILTTWSK